MHEIAHPIFLGFPRAIKRRRRLVLFATLMGGFWAVVFSILGRPSPTYTATARIILADFGDEDRHLEAIRATWPMRLR